MVRALPGSHLRQANFCLLVARFSSNAQLSSDGQNNFEGPSNDFTQHKILEKIVENYISTIYCQITTLPFSPQILKQNHNFLKGSHIKYVNGNQRSFYAAARSALARGAGVVSTRVTSLQVS